MDPQKPAEGISIVSKFANSTMFRVECKCMLPEHSVVLEIENEDSGPALTFYAETSTSYWRQYHPKWLGECYDFLPLLYNRIRNTISICFDAIFKGYVKTETTLIMSKQSALNMATTIIEEIKKLEKEK